MLQWFRLAADCEPDVVADIESGLANGELHPNEAKRRLARAVVGLYWGEGSGTEAESEFDQVFKHHGVPDEISEHQLTPDETVNVPALIRDIFDISGAEARRMLSQGAVKIDGKAITDQEMARAELIGVVLKVGKRRFARLVD